MIVEEGRVERATCVTRHDIVTPDFDRVGVLPSELKYGLVGGRVLDLQDSVLENNVVLHKYLQFSHRLT